MSAKAMLYLFDQEFSILYFNSGLHIPADFRGQPWGTPDGGIISLVIPTPKKPQEFLESMLSDRTINGSVRFYKWDGIHVDADLQFANAYIIERETSFYSEGTDNYTMRVVISPGIQKYRGTTFEKSWNPNDPFVDDTPVMMREEKEEKKEHTIKQGFWLSEKGTTLSQSNHLNTTLFYGEKVKIKVVTENATNGEEIEVEIKGKTNNGYQDLSINKKSIHITLKVTNNEAISDPLYIDPVWYNEKIETYNYKNYKTEIKPEESLTLVYDAKFTNGPSDQKTDLPKNDINKLRPITYRRNYEELIGLFATSNAGTKEPVKNYENKFITSSQSINKIVDEFITSVTKEDVTLSTIKSLVLDKASALWDAAVADVQKGKLDDRPLYWARNKMQTWLKRCPVFKNQIDLDASIVKKGTQLEDIITLFEEKSRNYTGIDFSKAGTKKKVLITGFDPFQLDFNFIKYGIGPSTFNPSGYVALKLHNGFDNCYIQTCILPVKYEDFDKKVVENIIKSNINKVDLIMTTSLNGGNPKFDIEKYAVKYRSGSTDNMYIGTSINGGNDSRFSQLISGQDHYETSLPIKSLFKGTKEITIEGNTVRYDETKSPIKGSGGSYLSNEIMYRSTKLRDELNLNKPVGHFHIGNLKKIQNNTIIIKVIKEVIKKMSQ
ncbi:type VI secretion system tube protein TssD [Aquimarina pacifica]|uniref:type VI secretion system tube protein TssD n=1 Tax=Aquimarina pacifica TaxID=1296415 RepID=UPI0004704D3B|nr:type VI secretion system tube protein TssD [Aquimarina pacifica]